MSKFQTYFILGLAIVVSVVSIVFGFLQFSVRSQSVPPQTDSTEEINARLIDLLTQEQVNETTSNNANTEQAAAPVANAAQNAAPEEPAPTIVPPAPTATPEPEVDYVFTYLPERAECTTATEIVAHLLESWGYHIRLDVAPNANELYNHLTTEVAPEYQAHMTFCYSDPHDREYFRIHLDDLAIIGNGYYEDEELKLYTVSHTGFAAELEEQDHCLYNFLHEFNENPIPLRGQTPTDFLFDNHNQVDLWGDCYDRIKEKNLHD